MSSDLTVVVAHLDDGVPLDRCLAALERACTGLHTDVIVVQSDAVPPTPVPVSAHPMTVIRVTGGPLVPQLWSHGLDVARGRHVAFTIANCEVSDGWAKALLQGFADSVVGVGGPLECAENATAIDQAIYYLRYSAFLPSRVRTGTIPGELAGDNAAYLATALQRHRQAIRDGFWEVPFHRAVRKEGGQLAMQRDAIARFQGGMRLAVALRHRFAHGRHFGAWRVADGQRRWWQIVMGAPAVPFWLVLRAGRRVVNSSREGGVFLAVLPIVLLIATAWAVGEAVGAVAGAGLPDTRASGERDRQCDTPHTHVAAAR